MKKILNRAPVTKIVNREFKMKSEVSSKWEETPEGFLMVPVVVAQKMVLPYPEFGTKELLGDDIFSKEYLESCDGCPFVLDHPVDEKGKPTDVLPENFDQFVKGVLYDPKVERENDRVVGKLKVWDADVIAAIKSGELRELSQGYTCNLIDKAGVFNGEPYDGVQTQVVMNHLALVSAGRAGDAVTVLNSLQRQELRKLMQRIERRRENMKVKTQGRANVDEQTTEAGKPNPQNAEETPDQQAAEDARFKAIEDKLDTLAAAVAKLAGVGNADPDAETEPQKDEQNAEGETPKPDDKANMDEKAMNKITNSVLAKATESLSAKIPGLIQNTIAQQTEAFLQAQVLIGEDAQDYATRLNDLTAFRKSVLVRNGMPKAQVDQMSAAEAKVWLSVRADQAKEIQLQPRHNGHSGYTDSGDRKALANSEF